MNGQDELKQSGSAVNVTDQIARRISGASGNTVYLSQHAEARVTTAETESVCENGICTVTWKPERPAA